MLAQVFKTKIINEQLANTVVDVLLKFCKGARELDMQLVPAS